MLDVFDVIDSDDSLVTHEFLRLFDQAFDLSVRVGDGHAETVRVLYDPVDNGLAAHGQQALGQVVGVGAHALALAGDWQNDFHFLLILWF